MKKKQFHFIVHPTLGNHDNPVRLCHDGKWRSGVSYGLGKLDTVVYKSHKAAIKKIDKIVRMSNGKFVPTLLIY